MGFEPQNPTRMGIIAFPGVSDSDDKGRYRVF
jgi:hypothetical protein